MSLTRDEILERLRKLRDDMREAARTDSVSRKRAWTTDGDARLEGAARAQRMWARRIDWEIEYATAPDTADQPERDEP